MVVKETARSRILAATLRIIGTDGVAAVTNRRIAAEAKVSLGSVTYHFATQDDLLRDALLEFVTAETARLSDLAEEYRSADLDLAAAAALVEQVAAELSFTTEQIASFELFVHAGRDSALRPAAEACFAAYDDLAATILTGLGIPDATAVAPAVVAALTGLQLRRLATGKTPDDVNEILLAVLQPAGRDA